MNVWERIEMASGRYWGSAERATMTDYGDCFTNRFYWADGALEMTVHDTREEAVEQMTGLGFVIKEG